MIALMEKLTTEEIEATIKEINDEIEDKVRKDNQTELMITYLPRTNMIMWLGIAILYPHEIDVIVDCSALDRTLRKHISIYAHDIAKLTNIRKK